MTTKRPTSLDAIVVSETGEPVPKVRVRYFLRQFGGSEYHQFAIGFTDEQGCTRRYPLDGLSVGHYRLIFELPDNFQIATPIGKFATVCADFDALDLTIPVEVRLGLEDAGYHIVVAQKIPDSL